MKILHKYIIRETIPYFFFSLLLLTFLGILQRLMRMVNLIFTRDVSPVLVLKILMSYFPQTLSLTIPMSILVAVLMAYGRMSGDKEITALRSSGVNLFSIIKPVLTVSFIIVVVMIYLNLKFIPDTYFNARRYLHRMGTSSPLISIQENKFNKIGNILINVSDIDSAELSFRNVHIEDYSHNENRTILGRKGRLERTETGFNLIINDAAIHQLDGEGKYRIITPIKQISLPINIFDQGLTDVRKTVKMMTYYELIDIITNKETDHNERTINNARVHLAQMFVIPFASLAFAFIAAPLGLISKTGKSVGLGLSFIVIFIYYILLSVSETIALKGMISPFIILWTPNVVLVIMGILLIRKVIAA